MSTNEHEPLFVLDNDNDKEVKEDPNVIRGWENLVTAERLQQEHAKQRQLERAQCWAEVEAERLRWEVKEVETKQKELEEVEIRRLEEVKCRSKRKRGSRNSAWQSCMHQRRWQSGGRQHWQHHCPRLAWVGHHLGSLKGAWRGPTMGQGSSSLRRIVHGSHYAFGNWTNIHGAVSSANS